MTPSDSYSLACVRWKYTCVRFHHARIISGWFHDDTMVNLWRWWYDPMMVGWKASFHVLSDGWNFGKEPFWILTRKWTLGLLAESVALISWIVPDVNCASLSSYWPYTCFFPILEALFFLTCSALPEMTLGQPLVPQNTFHVFSTNSRLLFRQARKLYALFQATETKAIVYFELFQAPRSNLGPPSLFQIPQTLAGNSLDAFKDAIWQVLNI